MTNARALSLARERCERSRPQGWGPVHPPARIDRSGKGPAPPAGQPVAGPRLPAARSLFLSPGVKALRFATSGRGVGFPPPTFLMDGN